MASKAQLELQRVKEITQILGKWGGGQAAAVETVNQSRVLGADGVIGQEQAGEADEDRPPHDIIPSL